MSTQDVHQAHDESAADYDRLAREYRWFGPEVLFGLCFEYMQPGQSLLDIGIGTGLCAAPFAKLGLQVFGLDISPGMLDVCKAKGLAVELRQIDISATPWPYPDGRFDHAVACGMLHFLGDLDFIFREVVRLVRVGGLFAFTSRLPDNPPGPTGYGAEIIDGVTVYAHSATYIDDLAGSRGFDVVKDLIVLFDEDGNRQRPYRALVTRKNDARRSEYVKA